jgi:hypothetical protein
MYSSAAITAADAVPPNLLLTLISSTISWYPSNSCQIPFRMLPPMPDKPGIYNTKFEKI